MESTSSPILSVIIPVYNTEQYIARCLDSVLSQSYKNIEVICIDDGSIDSSLEILHSYANKDSRIRIIEQQNKGVSAARNVGIDAAKGIYISFVDSDDVVAPNIYEKIFSIPMKNVEGICFSAYEIEEYSNNIYTKSNYFNVKFSGITNLKDNDILQLSATVWDKIFITEKIKSINLRFAEGVLYEDNAFVLNYFIIYRNILFIKDKLYFYYRNKYSITSKTRRKKENMAFNYIKIIENIYQFWNSHNLFSSHKPLFEKACLRLFRSALSSCQDWEQAGLVYALANMLRKNRILPDNNYLKFIMDGNYHIYIGNFPSRDINMLKIFHFIEKIFYIGNCRDKKVIYIFSIKVASWKRKNKIDV